MLVTRAGLAATCLAMMALAAVPSTALADADPASDFLPTQDVFVPYQPPIANAVKADLLGVTKAAKRAGYPIKVAVIATAVDLGGVPNLFNQPTRYAPYLGREISFNSKGQPLLVVMPVGFGTYQAGPRAASAIAKVKVGSGPDGLGRSAVEAVQKLAAAAGHPIRVQAVVDVGFGGRRRGERADLRRPGGAAGAGARDRLLPPRGARGGRGGRAGALRPGHSRRRLRFSSQSPR